MKRLGKVLIGVLLALLWLWTLGASLYAAGGLGWLALAAYVLATLVVILYFRPRFRLFVFGTWLISLVWFWTLTPSNDRDWCVDVSRLASADIDGSKVVVRNVRDFRYRSADDFDARWEDRTYDLDEITGAYLVMCHWGTRAIAHTMISFEFDEDEYLCLSVEIRPEKGESWNPIAGIYRQTEIIYVLGDERDLVNLRTSYRDDEVHLYRLRIRPEDLREYFVRVLERINELAGEPEFYDTLDYNCTSALTRMVAEVWPEKGRRSGIRSLLNGYTGESAHRQGSIRDDIPFEELRRKSDITEIGREHRNDPEFSRRVREKLPR